MKSAAPPQVFVLLYFLGIVRWTQNQPINLVTLVYFSGTIDLFHFVDLSLPVIPRMSKKKVAFYKKTNLSSSISLHQQWTWRDSSESDPASGRVRGDPSAGHRPLPQRPRERGAADLGVHQAAAAEARGLRSLKPAPCPRRAVVCCRSVLKLPGLMRQLLKSTGIILFYSV